MTLEQEKTIELIKNNAKRYKYIIGIILCGSLAKNTENENSDIDIFVIVDDIEFEKRKLCKDYFVGTIFEQSNYPVDIDGKIINKDFLKKYGQKGMNVLKIHFVKFNYYIQKIMKLKK